MSEPETVSTEYSVEISQLSEASQEVVHEAIDFATATHSLDSLDVREVIEDANAADAHRAQAEEYQLEQSRAAKDGDWERASEFAQKAQGELESVADHGGSDVPAAQAEADVMNLDNARWEQRIANENATAATTYAEHGDAQAAAIYGEVASDHQALADDSGHDGTSAAHEATHEAAPETPPEHTPDADAAGAGVADTPSPTETAAAAE